jgi:glycosyltransferase involved in cell wall biosynthesis
VLALSETPARVREIVVADNAPEGSARDAVEALRPGASVPLLYVHAPRPGVATARNAALSVADAPLIAFIDDDEEAEAGWLAALLAAHARFGADVTFGPIRGRIEAQNHWARAYLERLFSRAGPAESGLTTQAWGCGNSLMTARDRPPGAPRSRLARPERRRGRHAVRRHPRAWRAVRLGRGRLGYRARADAPGDARVRAAARLRLWPEPLPGRGAAA